MKHTDWRKRISERTDMVARITHLTRGKDSEEAFEKLWKILLDKKINGSGNSGFINGTRKAVCLQELPLSAIAENLMYEKTLGDKIRYSPFGIRFHKGFIYKQGGRPVIYEDKDIMKDLLPEELNFNYGNIEVVVESGKYYCMLVNRCLKQNKTDILTGIHGIITLDSVYS